MLSATDLRLTRHHSCYLYAVCIIKIRYAVQWQLGVAIAHEHSVQSIQIIDCVVSVSFRNCFPEQQNFIDLPVILYSAQRCANEWKWMWICKSASACTCGVTVSIHSILHKMHEDNRNCVFLVTEPKDDVFCAYIYWISLLISHLCLTFFFFKD